MRAAQRAARWAQVILTLGAGCALVPKPPEPKPEERAWVLERDRFTRTTKLYDRFDDRAFARATYQALSVREARVACVAMWQETSEERRQAELERERAEAAQFEEFLVSFYTSEHGANDLDSANSVWRVELEVPGEIELSPARIEALRVDATLQLLYPYIGNFDTVYRLRFPHYAGEQPLAEVPFVLRIAGALGRIELSFDGKPQKK